MCAVDVFSAPEMWFFAPILLILRSVCPGTLKICVLKILIYERTHTY